MSRTFVSESWSALVSAAEESVEAVFKLVRSLREALDD